MNWNRIEGNWKQFKGKAQAQWGKLTDDHLDVVTARGWQDAFKRRTAFPWMRPSGRSTSGHVIFATLSPSVRPQATGTDKGTDAGGRVNPLLRNHEQ